MRRFAIVVSLLPLVAGCGGEQTTRDAAPPERPVARSQLVEFHDEKAAISVRYPADWDLEEDVSNFEAPFERLALASYPLFPGSDAGECLPRRPLDDMPPDGAFIYLQESRPVVGRVWADLDRDDFPRKPDHFRLRVADFERNVYCHSGPLYQTRFRAADRPLTVFVAFGEQVTRARVREVEAILNSLRFGPLPPPPPDPYEGWTLVANESGDTFMPPPGWAAAAAFMPRRLPRPRTLFFSSNVPLLGLPAQFAPDTEGFTRDVRQLPAPFPSDALGAFPPEGVLLWIAEERTGAASEDFPAITRRWPEARDFGVASAGPAQQWAELTWLRAAGSFRGFRFTVWIVLGSDAHERDRALAIKSAGSLAVSGCLRDGSYDCPEE